MKKVNVILSTYNGEKYIRELFQSIIEQTYQNIDVWIRDDGSTDKTVEIVQEYCVQIFEGVRFHYLADSLGNLKTGKSLCKILEQSDDADAYAFCDQDDVWAKDKIQRAVEIISKEDEDKCVLYAAGYEICDKDLNVISRERKPIQFHKMSVGKSFFNYGAGLGQGFTLVCNHTMRKLAFQSGYDDIRIHDVWLWAVIKGLNGVYIYDDYPSAKYRRHGATVSPTGKGIWKLWQWRFQKFIDKPYFMKLLKGVDTYRKLFAKQVISEEDKCFLRLFGDYTKFGKMRLKKACYPYRLKYTWPEELALRFAFLCGRG